MAIENLAVWSIPPDWQGGIMESLSWLTSVTESPNAVEQRMGLRISPRQSFEIGYTIFNGVRSYFDLLTMAASGSPIYLPLWHDQGKLTVAAEAGFLGVWVDTQYTEFKNCQFAMLYTDPFNYEMVEIESLDDTLITLVDGLVNDWPLGSRIYPVKKCRVESYPSGERHADRAFKPRMRFISLEPNDSDAEAVVGEYLDNPVLEDEPNEAGGVSYDYQRKTYTLDLNTGLQTFTDVAPYVNQNHPWFARGRLKGWNLRGLLYMLMGKRRPLWVPSYFADFELVEATATQTLIVKRCGYSDTGGPFLHRDHILIHMRDGTRMYREILEAAINGDNEEINIDTVPDVELTPDNVLRISFITFCRLDQDTIELVHHTDTMGVTTATLIWRTDPGIGANYSETITEVDPAEPPDPLLPAVVDPFRVPAGKLWQYYPSFPTFSGSDYVGIWWAFRRTAEELIEDDPSLPDNIDEAFLESQISGSGAYVVLPLTGSFVMKIGLYWHPMGWTPPTQVTLKIMFLNSDIPDREMIFGSGIAPEIPLDPDQRNVYTSERIFVEPHMTDPEVGIQVHLEYKFIGGVNARPTCNPDDDCTPYHGSTDIDEGGDAYWILEWFR